MVEKIGDLVEIVINTIGIKAFLTIVSCLGLGIVLSIIKKMFKMTLIIVSCVGVLVALGVITL